MSDLFLDNIRLPSGVPTRMIVRDGRIEAVARDLAAPEGLPVLDGQGWTVFPGAIDMHVHFRTPGGEHKETLLTGAAAAVKGGTTTCADMPNTSPHTTTMAALEQKIALAVGAHCNLLYNFGAAPDNLADVRAAAKHPAVKALKIYMGPSTGHGGLDPKSAQEHFRNAADIGLPVMVHAEDLDLIVAQEGAHPHDAAHHHELRALEAELRAVEHALAWAKDLGVRLYLAHSTSVQVLERVAASGLDGQVFVEVCLHHLLLSTDDIRPPVENRFKVNPPIRPEAERAALFARLAEGIDVLGTDHAPHTLEEKHRPYDEAPSGIPGVEYLFPFALTWWAEGRISLERLLALTSGNASRFFGLNKGSLSPGADADLVLVNLEETWEVGGGDDPIASKCGWTVYEGRQMRGRPEVTVVGGKVVYDRSNPEPDWQ